MTDDGSTIPPNSIRAGNKRSEKLTRIACILGLIALPMMVWSVFDPRAIPVLVALSIGQGIGTLSFVLYLTAIVLDTKLLLRLRRSK